MPLGAANLDAPAPRLPANPVIALPPVAARDDIMKHMGLASALVVPRAQSPLPGGLPDTQIAARRFMGCFGLGDNGLRKAREATRLAQSSATLERTNHLATRNKLLALQEAHEHLDSDLAAARAAQKLAQADGVEGLRKLAECEANVAALQKRCDDQDTATVALLAKHAQEMAQLSAYHDGLLDMWKKDQHALGTLRLDEEDAFHYVVTRGNEHGAMLRGSVPRCVLTQRDPASLLARKYAGLFPYLTDGEGAAKVNSNPAHWPHILDWLSFGAVPDKPSRGLIAEAEDWLLDDFVAGMKESGDTPAAPDAPTCVPDLGSPLRAIVTDTDIVRIWPPTNGFGRGFRAQVDIKQFIARRALGDVRVWFAAGGHNWVLACLTEGICIMVPTGEPPVTLSVKFVWGFDAAASTCGPFAYKTVQPGRHWGFALNPDEIEALKGPPLLQMDGRLPIFFDVAITD